jgi:tetratricopeptide (TPR) repeat protein
LRQWQEQRTRDPASIVRMYLAAGRGLAAAHRAGLVHRDFKPDNVLTNGDVVKVVDFGLALGQARDLVDDTGRDDGAVREVLAQTLTATGGLLGTPAYMAPEQFLRATVDARTDQFAFCIALYEALYGERPFGGGTVAMIGQAVTSGERKPLPVGRTVPAHVVAVIDRGLQVDPAARHASMEALLVQLTHDPAQRRRRAWLAGASGLAIVGAFVGGTMLVAREPACERAGDSLASTWAAHRRERVRVAIADDPAAYADATADRAVARLDAFAAEWIAARKDACLATHVRHEQSEVRLDERMACLDLRARALDETARLLEAEAKATDAIELVYGLPAIAGCAARPGGAAPLPEVAGAVEHLRSELAASAVRIRAGHFAKEAELIAGLADEIAATQYEPLLAEAAVQHGRALDRAARFDDAAERARVAFAHALASDHHVAAADAATMAVMLHGARLAEPELATLWHSLARVSVDRQAERTVAEARLAGALGAWAAAEGRLDEAIEHSRHALELDRAHSREPTPEIATDYNNLGSVLGQSGQLDEARAALGEALAMRETLLGSSHPLVGHTLGNLGAAQLSLGDIAGATASFERCLEILELAYPSGHPELANCLKNLGVIDRRESRVDSAVARLRRALQIEREVLPATHPALAATASNLANALDEQGHPDEAVEHHRFAVGVFAAARGEDHRDTAQARLGLGDALMRRGALDEAITVLEQARVVLEAGPASPQVLGALRFALAQALAQRDPARARALGEAALEDHRTAKLPTEPIETWLDETSE